MRIAKLIAANGSAAGSEISDTAPGVYPPEGCLTAKTIMVSCPAVDLEKTAPMLSLDDWNSIRWLHRREGRSIRSIAKEFRISRKTVTKYLADPDPPKYHSTQARSKPVTDLWFPQVEQIVEDDKNAPRKQRHTAKRIFERLLESGYDGSARTVRLMVAEIKNKPSASACVPLVFKPGKDAQVDFGESYAKIAGKQVKLHGFEMRMSFSRKKFLMFFPSTDKEAFLEGHVRAFEYFGGVVDRISYDNLGAAIAQMGKGKNRTLTNEFKKLTGFYGFRTNFCKPGIEGAHEKGGIESDVGFSRRNWMVPVPEFDSIDELNSYLLGKCQEDDARTVDGQPETIAEAWTRDKAALLPLPTKAFDPCVQQTAIVDSYCTLSFKNNRYSVPPQYVGKILTIRSYWNRVEISTGLEFVTNHVRSYEKNEYVLRPEHYLDLLERRPHSIPYARPLVQHEWPSGYWELYGEMVASVGSSQAGRDFIRVLQCHVKYGAELVANAIAEVSQLDKVNGDIVIAAIDRRRIKVIEPDAIEISEHPALAHHKVVVFTEPAQYGTLTQGEAR